MRDPKRIPLILRELKKVWKQNSDYRLTQLIIAIARTGEVCPKLLNIVFILLLRKSA